MVGTSLGASHSPKYCAQRAQCRTTSDATVCCVRYIAACSARRFQRSQSQWLAVSEFCSPALRTAEPDTPIRSEEHTSELQSLMRRPYAVLCLKQNKQQEETTTEITPLLTN